MIPRRAGAAIARAGRARRAFALPARRPPARRARGSLPDGVEDLAAPVISLARRRLEEVGQIAAGAVAAPPPLGRLHILPRLLGRIAPRNLAAAVLFASGVVVKYIFDTPSSNVRPGPR